MISIEAKAKRLFQVELNNGRIDNLIDIIENGHPSITGVHPYYKELKELESYSGCELLELYNEAGKLKGRLYNG